jgi:uncharacterized membrane protein
VTVRPSDVQASYEARREAAPAVIIAVLILAGLALASRRAGWELLGLPWWIWLLLAVPGALLCADLWLGASGMQVVRTRTTGLVLLGVLSLGNVIGLVLLIAALVSSGSKELGGPQLLFTAVAIWAANVIVFGVVYWDIDDGGPFARASEERKTPDFQFPQDENPELARPGWRPRIWDYMYVALTAGSAFSPTDAMPLTYRAKLLLGVQSTVSLVLVVLVTARAVNVLGS